jgi:hypothetical protein
MTPSEFSNQFDVLVNSYTRFRDFDNKEPRDTIEFDEYEKSLYLTKAQEELVRGLYNGRNSLSESFEQTEELRRYLSDLVVEAELQPTVTSNGLPLGVDSNSKFFTLPEDLWFITYEEVKVSDSKCEDTSSLEVYPVRQDEYHRIKKNPFRGANERRALRLDLSEGVIEIVCKYTVTKYYLRYLQKLSPIILADLPNGITIGHTESFTGNTVTPCYLHEGLHQKILELAVLMALQSKGFNVRNSNENK